MPKYLITILIFSLSFQACENNETEEASEVELFGHDSLHAVHYASDNFDEQQGVEVVQSELDFGKLLIHIESQLGWENVEYFWKSRRDDWVLDCQNAVSVQDKSNVLIEFENIIRRKDLTEDWKKLRINWLANSKKATLNNEIGKYLIELESNILWDNVSPDWQLERQKWIRDCKAL